MSNERTIFKRNPVSYSIWLIPDDKIKKHLGNKINLLNSNFGGPTFEPHVTLVSSFLGIEKDLLRKTEMISRKLKPFEIFFEGIGSLNKYFCSLFLIVRFSKELKTARDIACQQLNWYDNKYLPHMSLAYGNYDLKTKEKMISSVDAEMGGFSVNKILLAHNDEINLVWKILGSFPFTK